MAIDPKIEESWKQALIPAFNDPSFATLKSFLQSEKKKGKVIFPPSQLIFNAFNLTPINKVKVVVIGQDPYHGVGQAHGLSFSVQKGVKTPPSLKNIYKELKEDIDFKIPEHGNLEKWANQGVFLLNAMLTVEAHKAGSHQKKGWEEFTNSVIKTISEQRKHVVFLLWGNFAKSKAELIDHNKHLILESAHPSPFSAYNGFFGNKHFSKTNEYLIQKEISPIDWQID